MSNKKPVFSVKFSTLLILSLSIMCFTLISILVCQAIAPQFFMQEKNFNRLVLGLTGVFGILFGMFYIVIIRYFLKSMTGFKKILNEMGTHIFIADAETHQIQFMNDAMKEQYGLDDTVIGKRCWEALQTGLTEPCAFCPIPKLISQAQGSLIWEEYNTKTNRYYKNTSSIIIWGPIKRAYLQHSVDIHELKAVETTLTKRLQQEELLSAISQSFISTKELPVIINNALGLIGIFMNVSKVVLARLNKETSMLEYEYEWYNEAQQLSKLSKRLYLFSPGGILYDTFISQGKQYLVCNDIEAYPDFKQVFSPLGIKAFISVPIVIQGEFWGVLGIDECIAPHQWDESDIQFSQLVANAIAGTIIRVVAEKQLLRMSSIVDSTPQYVSYFNASGHFEYINQGVCTISGYSSEELMRHGMDLLFDEETRSFIHEIFIPTVLERGAHQTEVPLIRKDGEQRILSFSSFTVGVKKEGIGGIATDITELRQLESALIAAKERAEQSNTAKSNFLSRMSHEMRTPMNAIIGMTAIAQTSYSQKKIEYCLTKINEASVHLLGVINDILDMSKIEAGKFELSPSEFNLEKLLLRVTNVMNFRIAEKRQDFIVYMDQRLPNYIIADEQRLAQIITNLLSNAVKFTPEEGTVVLSVKQTAQEGGGCTIQCSVSDTGIGISTEQQGRLFSLFEQADGSIARKYGGTGLGLAISKNILDLMGGSIEVVSALGKGATFTFEIKVETGKGKEKEKEILNPKTGWEGLRILAVDDSPEVLDYIREFVQTYGIHFYGASDGEEAYQLLEAASREFGETPFDLVFVDWRMPRINGIELTKKIKARFGPNLVVIMISAAEWAGIEEEAKAAGLDGFLPKPLFPSVIADCINSYFHIVPFEREEVKAAYITQDIFAGHCILLAEDVEINREIVLDLLEPTGITIDTAENGKQAIKMFEEEPEKYRLILMDIHMPEMDGFEAARLIRELPTKAAQEIPIVAMTANVFREDIEKCLAAGMNDHLGKPIDIEELMKKLKYYLLPSLP